MQVGLEPESGIGRTGLEMGAFAPVSAAVAGEVSLPVF